MTKVEDGHLVPFSGEKYRFAGTFRASTRGFRPVLGCRTRKRAGLEIAGEQRRPGRRDEPNFNNGRFAEPDGVTLPWLQGMLNFSSVPHRKNVV